MFGLARLIEIELGDLKSVSKEFAESLGQRMKIQVTVKGKTALVPDVASGRKLGAKDVKIQVKHVIHQLGFSEEYRVLTEHHRIRIVKVEEKARPMEKGGTTPPPSQSLPYFFP